MNELKFRGWDGKQMLYFPHLWMCNEYSSLCFDNNTEEGKLGIAGFTMIGFDYDKAVITQYTGLKDKNNNDIYIGDVVKGNRTKEGFYIEGKFYQGFSGEGQTSKKEFEFREVKFEVTERSVSLNLPKDMSYSERDERNTIYWEVVGNIYENPELLNKKY